MSSLPTAHRPLPVIEPFWAGSAGDGGEIEGRRCVWRAVEAVGLPRVICQKHRFASLCELVNRDR
jgi:hypothetical protein